MDHGDPSLPGRQVFFCSDEHTTFVWGDDDRPRIGDRVSFTPAHVDPTVAYHERMWLVRGDDVVGSWAVDLRNW
jgi:D-serine deaminase-like pyridoxal phosphate-dependent protein